MTQVGIDDDREHLVNSSNKSFRRLSHETDYSNGTCQRAAMKAGLHAYRVHVRGSLRKLLDTHQLSTIIEILPLHLIIILSLSIYAMSHPPEPRFEALAPVTVIRCT